VLTYNHDDLIGTDEITGTLNRVSGEAIGEYAINNNGANPLTAGPNYQLVIPSGTQTVYFEIRPIALTVKVYDEASALNADLVELSRMDFISGNIRPGDDIHTIVTLTTNANKAVAGDYDIVGNYDNSQSGYFYYAITFIDEDNVVQPATYTVLAANQFVVDFDTDCETIIPNQIVNSGGYVTEPTQPMNKPGFTFEYWHDGYITTDPYEFTTTQVTMSFTLYAKWTLNPIDLSITGNEEITYGEGSVTLTANVTHEFASTATYQWYKDNNLLTGKTTNQITLTDVLESGTYKVKATITREGQTVTKEESVVVTINKATYDMSNVSFNDAQKQYNAQAQPIYITVDGELPDGVSVNYQNNSNVNAGEHTVTAVFTGDSNNYNAIPNKSATLTITKAPATLDIANKSSVYGQPEETLTATLTGMLVPADTILYTLSRADSTNKNAGQYSITANITQPNNNYDLTINNGTYTITKATYDMTGITFPGHEKVYDGLTYPLSINGTLPDGVSVTYQNNDQVNAGSHTVTAKFSGDATNYNAIPDMTATLKINKATYNMSGITFPGHEKVYDGSTYPLSINGTLPDGVSVTYQNNDQVNAGSHTVTAKFSGDATNYNVIPDMTATLKINKANINTVTIHGDLNTGQSKPYTNGMGSQDITDVKSVLVLKINGTTVLSDEEKAKFNFVHYSIDNLSSAITTVNLPNGGTTFVIRSNIVGYNGSNFEGTYSQAINQNSDVAYKFVSVLVGEEYKTIEDAILSGNNMIVTSNTSFASSVVNTRLHNTNIFTLTKSLLLPAEGPDEDGNYANSIIKTTSASSSRPSTPYVKLVMTSDITLNINTTSGHLNVNGKVFGGTPRTGYVIEGAFGAVEMMINSKVVVNSGGLITSIGFVYGQGTVEIKSGGKIMDLMTFGAFRGGRCTAMIKDQTFPVDQFHFNNIEVDLKFNAGATYEVDTYISTGAGNLHEGAVIIGSTDSSLFKLTSGYLIKKFSTTSGRMTVDIDGATVNMNNITVGSGAISMSTNGKEILIPGTFTINLTNNTTVTNNIKLALLPGSQLNIDSTSKLIVPTTSSLLVYGPNEYIQDSGSYIYPSSQWQLTFRNNITFDFNINTPAKVTINGILDVRGGIAGKINSENGGTLILADTSKTVFASSQYIGTDGGTFITHYHTLKDPADNLVFSKGTFEIIKNQTFSKKITFTDDQNNVTTLTQQFGTPLNAPTLPSGWGWFDGTNEIITNRFYDGRFSALTAKQLVTTSTITFVSNGGTSYDPLVIENNSVINLNESYRPTKDATDLFLGWYTNSTLTTKLSENHTVSGDLTVYARWANKGIQITATTSGPGRNDKKFKITATVKDGNGTPLSGITVDIETLYNSGNFTTNHIGLPTNASGQVTATHDATLSGAGDRSMYIKYYIVEHDSKTFVSTEVQVKTDASSPMIYSYDGEEYHLEHEPISFKLLKSIEGSSYGTLRLLEDVNGKYYIQVVEEGTSITVMDNLQLYAVDYINDGTILDLFFDIYGNPHTIKEKLTPVSFIDQYGISYMDGIITKGDGYFAQADMNRDDIVTYMTATFDKPTDSNFAKLMVSVKDTADALQAMHEMYQLFNAKQNLWWIDQALAHQDVQPLIQNVFNSLHVKVQVWNGTSWIDQGIIELGSYLMEEFLVPLDLTDINTEDLVVRFVYPTKGGYMFDSIAVDYSENAEMNIMELDLVSALMNGDIDVLDQVISANNQYVELAHKEYVEFAFAAPALQEGYSRGFGVKMTGYIYAEGCTVTDELQPLMEGKNFDEIVDIIIASGRQELIDDIEIVANFYYTITTLGALDYEDLLRELFNFMPEE
jgi:hypothetical protein